MAALLLLSRKVKAKGVRNAHLGNGVMTSSKLLDFKKRRIVGLILAFVLTLRPNWRKSLKIRVAERGDSPCLITKPCNSTTYDVDSWPRVTGVCHSRCL